MSKIGILYTVKTLKFDGISALRARLGHFQQRVPPKPFNTTYREMSGISIIQYIYHTSKPNRTYCRGEIRLVNTGLATTWAFSQPEHFRLCTRRRTNHKYLLFAFLICTLLLVISHFYLLDSLAGIKGTYGSLKIPPYKIKKIFSSCTRLIK